MSRLRSAPSGSAPRDDLLAPPRTSQGAGDPGGGDGRGIEAFASQADGGLLATGERARQRTVETREDLTPHELQIARLARDGLSNPEIGARLFISPRTGEYHFHKVFTKLGIRSRNELDR